ncbi:MAG: Ldh family oxidoreductase [Gammaproteobacteria bacterium]|nr:Ldh family oxidoreductase [Gammaproteobacteria bacterium]
MVKKSKSNVTKKPFITLRLGEFHDLACELLKQRGTAQAVASQVVDELVMNEMNGYRSHGLLRLLEYVQLLEQGHIISDSQPLVHKKNEFLTDIHGKKCFGVLSAQAISEALIQHLRHTQFGFVKLINSGHIGRLRSIASPVCEQGGVVIGFSNLSGAGQNVLAYGGNKGRLCTNPIVIGVPSKPPIILDMSTSTVSEGKVRERWLKGEKVPRGWLFDKDWHSVCDPEKFYKNPKEAFLAPLGGKELGYKGFGLGLMTEIFAGILTDGGFSQATSAAINNNALFFVFHPSFLGQTLEAFQEKVDVLIQYLRSSSVNDELHVPDWNVEPQLKNLDEKQSLSIDLILFKKLKKLLNA